MSKAITKSLKFSDEVQHIESPLIHEHKAHTDFLNIDTTIKVKKKLNGF